MTTGLHLHALIVRHFCEGKPTRVHCLDENKMSFREPAVRNEIRGTVSRGLIVNLDKVGLLRVHIVANGVELQETSSS